MEKADRFGVSMPQQLAETFDQIIKRKGYTNRSEAIRDLIRRYMIEEEWATQNKEVVGTVTLVYDHHTHDLGDVLTHIQHDHQGNVVCSQHVHLDANNCLETIVLRGKASQVQQIADHLIGTKGVKHGQLVCTTTGQTIV